VRPQPIPRDPLELAAGQVLRSGAPVDLSDVPTFATPRAALEAVLLPALASGHCLVSFSGGRDSSAVLAAASALAKREGLRPPIPVTMRFPAHEQSDERSWQEQIVKLLGLPDWQRLDFGEELHILGPVARGLVRRHGVVFPPNSYLHVPLLEPARGGVLLTGIGGDEIVGGVRWSRTAAVLEGRRFPRPRDVLGIGFALTPTMIRHTLSRRALRGIAPWLRPRAHRRALNELASHWGAEPITWPDRLRWWLEAPYIQAAQNTFDVLAADARSSVLHPLLDRRFVATVARLSPDDRWTTRTAGMRALFADLLPDDVLRRRGKASFTHIFSPDPRLELVRRWSGEGIDEELVDPATLRRTWTAEQVDPGSIPLLQHVAHVLEVGRQRDVMSSTSSATRGNISISRGR
jgi:asparagine synthetase B (glutamine-hydrolysing)